LEKMCSERRFGDESEKHLRGFSIYF